MTEHVAAPPRRAWAAGLTRPGNLLVWSAIAGLATALSFPPVGWWWLSPVSLMPLLFAWRHSSARRSAACGLIYGIVAYGIVCAWMWFFGAVAFAPFVLAMAAFPAAAGYTVALVRRSGVRGPWIEAAVWVTFEGLRSRFPFGGMPWATVGSALAPVSAARALAPIGGVLLASFVVVAANGLLLDLALRVRAVPRAGRALVRAGAGVLALATLLALAVAVRPTPRVTGALRVATLQGNDLNRRLTNDEIRDNYLRASHFALAAELRGDYDLIVFPESALDGEDPETDAGLKAEVTALARRHRSWVMLNVNEERGGVTYNTNRIYDPQGLLVASYSKQHLVPFGEYLPFEWVKAIAPQIEQIGNGYAPGTADLVVPVAGRPLTTIICFESAFGPQVRRTTGRGAEGIVLSTNNRSYRRSANSAQHVQLSQWRAAELGRPLLQAAISGISANIDAQGRVTARTELFDRTTLEGRMFTTSGTTLYARLGDWVLLCCLAATLVGVLATLVRSERTGGAAGS